MIFEQTITITTSLNPTGLPQCHSHHEDSVINDKTTNEDHNDKDKEDNKEDNVMIDLSVGISGEKTTSNLCFLFLHGAGSSKETWHQQIKQFSSLHLCIAPDMRGHGQSSLLCDNLDIHILVHDCYEIIQKMNTIIGTRSIILICHSVGGTIGTLLSCYNNEIKARIGATIIIDLIEGTAIDSLSHMKNSLITWPGHFQDISQCIEFNIQHHRPINRYSANISVPPLLRYEENEHIYLWKTPLLKYETNWMSWFHNFNLNFLQLTCPHCLILATIDRLDTQMTTAHMQGRYELFVTHGGEGGHFIQEDNSSELLAIVVRFLSEKGILSNDMSRKLLQVGFTSVAVGGSNSVFNLTHPSSSSSFSSSFPSSHSSMRGGRGGGGGGEVAENYRSPFSKSYS